MAFLRKFLSDSGTISKECVTKLLHEVTQVFSKSRPRYLQSTRPT